MAASEPQPDCLYMPNLQLAPNPAALTSLPMAIQVRFQGSGWPMAARREPHLLRQGMGPGGLDQVRMQTKMCSGRAPQSRAGSPTCCRVVEGRWVGCGAPPAAGQRS